MTIMSQISFLKKKSRALFYSNIVKCIVLSLAVILITAGIFSFGNIVLYNFGIFFSDAVKALIICSVCAVLSPLYFGFFNTVVNFSESGVKQSQLFMYYTSRRLFIRALRAFFVILFFLLVSLLFILVLPSFIDSILLAFKIYYTQHPLGAVAVNIFIIIADAVFLVFILPIIMFFCDSYLNCDITVCTTILRCIKIPWRLKYESFLFCFSFLPSFVFSYFTLGIFSLFALPHFLISLNVFCDYVNSENLAHKCAAFRD